jgi:endoglucanase
MDSVNGLYFPPPIYWAQSTGTFITNSVAGSKDTVTLTLNTTGSIQPNTSATVFYGYNPNGTTPGAISYSVNGGSTPVTPTGGSIAFSIDATALKTVCISGTTCNIPVVLSGPNSYSSTVATIDNNNAGTVITNSNFTRLNTGAYTLTVASSALPANVSFSAPAINVTDNNTVNEAALFTVASSPVVAGSYSVGGTLSGLNTGLTVSLNNNGANSLSLSSNGAFKFSALVANNANYAVTVGTQPSGQTCTVSNGAGKVTANITTVSVSCTANSSGSTGAIKYRGVNLAGADFGESNLPGTFGVDYTYPTNAEATYFKSKGMNIIRLPFRWERLQPTLNAALDPTELNRLQTFVNQAIAAGHTVVLDPHNYARYKNNIIGASSVTNANFADFWGRLATVYKNNPAVIFGLMNEPNSMSTETWVAAANAAIASIRAAGANNVIAVPGNGWTGAHSWDQNWYGTANSIAMLSIKDSANNIMFEAHQYLDSNSSGTSDVCVSPTIGAERLVTFTNWLRTNGKKGFLGEFAGGNNATCNQSIANMLAYMQANADVWAGWTWWAAGPWWGGYIFTIEPSNGVDDPKLTNLLPYLK